VNIHLSGLFVMVAAALFSLTGCGAYERSTTPSPAAATNEQPEQMNIADYLAQLEQKIANLESRLGHSKGALVYGPNRLVDGGGNESVLEKLRRLDRELADAHLQLKGKDAEIMILREQVTQTTIKNKDATAQNDALGHVRDHLITAQQELTARKDTITHLEQTLTSSELQRLRMEQTYFTTVAAILRLMPGQAQELLDLQSSLRRQLKTYVPDKKPTPESLPKATP
jgi:chromosome segregation ATPase